MHCYTIQRSEIEFLPRSTDTGFLTLALARVGFEVATLDDRLVLRRPGTYGYYRSGSYEPKTGQLELSEHVVESQARKFGWQSQWRPAAARLSCSGEDKAMQIDRLTIEILEDGNEASK